MYIIDIRNRLSSVVLNSCYQSDLYSPPYGHSLAFTMVWPSELNRWLPNLTSLPSLVRLFCAKLMMDKAAQSMNNYQQWHVPNAEYALRQVISTQLRTFLVHHILSHRAWITKSSTSLVQQEHHPSSHPPTTISSSHLYWYHRPRGGDTHNTETAQPIVHHWDDRASHSTQQSPMVLAVTTPFPSGWLNLPMSYSLWRRIWRSS